MQETKIRERTVWAVSVKTKHLLSDMFQNIRNLIGANLIAYEKMIDDGMEEAYLKLLKKHPKAYNIKFTTAQVTVGACEIICYGTIKLGEEQ